MEGIIRQSVIFFCHDGNGKYLIHRRSKNCRDEQERWDSGGGGLKFGEKIEDAVRREVREEYTADAIQVEFLGYRDVFRVIDGNKTHWIAFDFRIQVDPTKVKIGEPHKVESLRWVTMDELLDYSEPVHSQLFPTIEKNRHFLV